MTGKSRIYANKWPWGTTPPRTRMSQIARMIEKTRAQIPIIEDQAREAIRRMEKNIEALEDELRMVSRFLEEEKRAENKIIAYRLAEMGVDQMERVDRAEDQEALGKELLAMLEEAGNDNDHSAGDLDTFLDSMTE